MYVGAVETTIATSTLNNQKLSNGTYEIVSGNICLKYSDNKCINELKVEVKGEIPNSGKITVSNGELVDLILNYENKTIVKSDNKLVYSYKEASNIEVPDLYNGTLTPVTYDGNNWVIADVSKKWYDYSKQEWANAVILKSDIDKKVGDKVTVDGENPDALAMFVWIPRYEYKIEETYGTHADGTEGTQELPGQIEVNFISSNKLESSEQYRIHPVFNFGGMEISGIWVAKFELSNISKLTSQIDCVDENCDEGNSLRILPNVSSFRCNENVDFFYAIRSMSKEENVFGINKDITDTHMIKNSEWGAVAYLSQSRYGKYGNADYSGREKEVYINNSSSMITGRSGGSYGGNTPINGTYTDQTDVTTQYVGTGYYTYDGYLLSYNTNTKTETRDMKKIASTTGNIYGIYDMNGGSHDGVMVATIDEEGNYYTTGNNFSGIVLGLGYKEGIAWPNKKYYDIYISKNTNTAVACNGGICYGHALSETELWYGNSKGFVWTQFPYLLRGGNFADTSSGIFSARQGTTYNGDRSTRVVLTPNT